MRMAVEQILEIIEPCDESTKLTRVIPVLIGIMRQQPTVILRWMLFSILKVLKTVSKIPDELDGYFDCSLRTEFHALYPNDVSIN
jgi:hypothetical protein